MEKIEENIEKNKRISLAAASPSRIGKQNRTKKNTDIYN